MFASAVYSGRRALKMAGMKKVLMGLTDLKICGQFAISDEIVTSGLVWAIYVMLQTEFSVTV